MVSYAYFQNPTDTKYSPDPKRFSFQDLEVDIVPESTALAIKFTDIHAKSVLEFQEILEFVPAIRKFQKKTGSVPLYLIFGCLLLENLIELENASVYAEFKKALRYLVVYPDIKDGNTISYKEIEWEFEEIVQAIQKERFYLQKEMNDDFDPKKLIRFLYFDIIPKANAMRTITIATRALFLSTMKQRRTTLSPEIYEQILVDPYLVYDAYTKDLCGLLSVMFSIKIDFIEANMEIWGKEKISKSEIYPNSSNKEFILNIVLLNIIGKTKNFKAFGYPIIESPKAKGDQKASDKQVFEIMAQKNANNLEFKGPNSQKVAPPSDGHLDEKESEEISNEREPEQVSNIHHLNPHESKSSPTKMKEEAAPKLIQCSLCKGPLNQNDVFVNKNCDHAFCIYCLNDIDLRYYTICFLKKCPAVMNPQDVKKFIFEWNEKQKQLADTAEQSKNKTNNASHKTEKPNDSASKETIRLKSCSYCKMLKDSSKMFENICGHVFCMNCIESKTIYKGSYCPMVSCWKKIDPKGLSDFIEELTKSLTVKTKIICPTCKREFELQFHKEAKPDYYKCTACNIITCLKHNRLMSNCLCLCDLCLNSFELSIKTMVKSCKKCGKRRFCAVCGTQDINGKSCECVCGLCLCKKKNKTDKLCDQCLIHQTKCSECQDLIDELNETMQSCGHKICMTCQQFKFEDEKNKGHNCKICNFLS